MAFKYLFKAAFQKAFDELQKKDQILTLKALECVKNYVVNGTAPHGLRIKKLYQGGSGVTFEARINLDLRLVWVQTKEELIFSLLGSHNEVKQFLRNL